VAIAGAIGGTCCAFVTGPSELAKIRMQILRSTSNLPFKGSLSYASYLVKTQGVRSLFCGTLATLIRDIPGYTLYFVSYSHMKDLFVTDCTGLYLWQYSPVQLFGQLAAGGIAGVLGWSMYPMEVVKTRIQAGEYNTIRSCAVNSYKNESWRVFFRGYGIAVLRALPVNAVTFIVYEGLHDMIRYINLNS
jgi:solute carrier family 25 (mitochondrial carnitine/acylcarnitine transporter), member 20/29